MGQQLRAIQDDFQKKSAAGETVGDKPFFL